MEANLEQSPDLLPIRALNDLLFCERRCALHRVEGVWRDNAYTLEGTHGHQRAHEVRGHELADGVRVVRGLWVRSLRLNMIGKADVVEFRPVPLSPAQLTPRDDGSQTVPFPIEYKRGRKRKWDNDDVQLCAQALCLEEMLGVVVPAGAVFHIKSKRRREITFTPALRARTEKAARRLQELVASGVTPAPVVKPRCRGCSLLELCMPAALSQTAKIQSYCRALLQPLNELP